VVSRHATGKSFGNAAGILSRTMPYRAPVTVLVASAFLAGCIVVPRTVDGYDPDCRIATHHMELDIVQLGRVNNCSRQDCVAVVAGLAVTAASAIVSGSIVVAGNAVYWAERRAGCALAAPILAAPVDSPAA
jgi:hypothetical protein